MTIELVEALFRDDIFQCGLALGIPFGIIICFVITCIDNYFFDKFYNYKNKEDKEK